MADKKYTVSIVSYWNTKPLLYGLEHAPVSEKIILQLDVPSAGAAKLKENTIDIGLVPVAVLCDLPDAKIITDYCIGSNGAVKSVCIFSEKPLEEIDKIFLDDHSITSVQLVKILLREYWKLSPELIPAKPGYIEQIKGSTAGLVIGDRAIAIQDKFPFVYDLGLAWKEMTGLPFVFAAWLTRKNIPSEIIHELNEALRSGVQNIDLVAEAITPLFTKEELKNYLKNNISFDLDADKKKALQLFIGKVKNSTKVVIED